MLRCLLLVTGSVSAQPFPFKFNYLTVDEGLSHTDANDVVQDSKGYIWVATNFGLDRYDGYTVRKFYNSNVPLHNAFKNRIIRLFPDRDGRIWLSTEDGLQYFDPKTEHYTDLSVKETGESPVLWKMFRAERDLLFGYADYKVKLFRVNGRFLTELHWTPPPGIRFFDIQPDQHGVMHFATSTGLWKLDAQRRFLRVPVEGLPEGAIRRVFFDKNNKLLVANDRELFRAENAPAWRVTKRFACSECSKIEDITVSRGSDYWLNTGSALIRLDRNLSFVQRIDHQGTRSSLNASVVSRIYIDRSDCLWAGTSGGGINYCDLNQKLFYTMRSDPGNPASLTGSNIRSVLEDGNDLWIGTNANGLNRYDMRSRTYRFYTTRTAVRLKSDVVMALALDNGRQLWIGGASGIEILSPDRKALRKPPGSEQFPKYSVGALVKDHYGNIWFGNLETFGVIWKDTTGRYRVREFPEGHFLFAEPDKPELLVSSRHGLKRITVDKEGNIGKMIRYRASSAPNALTSDYTSAIAKQNDSTYWIGTIGGALNLLTLQERNHTHTIRHFGEKQGVFNDVESIELDRAGNVWLGGDGLQCLDPVTGRITRYDKHDGLQGNSFKIRVSFKGAGGRLYFGGINGLNYFYPEQIRSNTIGARPELTDILINSRRPSYDNGKTNIGQAPGYGSALRLNHLQNNFVISFSAMHFANPTKCRYRYKLIGFDEEWKFTDGNSPTAAYSNLDYGDYRFVVEATNSDGIWGKGAAQTDIVITPPWWSSLLARVIYVLLFILALAGVYIYQARWYRLKREIDVRAVAEQKREEMHRQREELYQQQLLFFTNVSHEFRTPLSLILGPLENLISHNRNPVLDHSYQLMLRNARRLINLISELMNFKKVSDSLIRLQVQPLVISQFCEELATEFQSVAQSKHIALTVIDRTQGDGRWPLTGLFDIQVLEKILLNLLNNSFKYTQDGGEITLEVFTDMGQFKPSFETGFRLLNEEHRANRYLYFRVADTGIGISGDTITRIFDRYYRISRDHLGSGVGLALVKSLTRLHKGDIYVYSEHYKGTEIIIGVPLGEENWAENERAPSRQESGVRLEATDHSILIPLTDPSTGEQETTPATRKRILLVEDNSELRAFLKQTFDKQYLIYEAANGETALEIAAEKMPDLIISDVMMPGMSGIALCRQVKERFETSHIPFIILSAKDALASKIEGMESGADFYFAKPLSIDLLLLTVHNIFEQSEKLRQRFTNNYLSQATDLVHSGKDKEFFQALLELIEANMEDPDLDVDFLCKHLYTSRTKLYQKIKSITGQSVADFIRTIRLKKAIQIMTHEGIPLNQVVDRVGLQSSSNFSRVFKKEYGKSPLQFMQALKRNQT